MRSATTHIEDTEAKITRWLGGEERYQFAEHDLGRVADQLTAIDIIVTTELAEHWNSFQRNNRSSSGHEKDYIQLLAEQGLLKACAAARGAVALSYIFAEKDVTLALAEEKDISMAIARTGKDLTDHFAWLRQDPARYPAPTVVEKTLAEVVHPVELTDGLGTEELRTVYKNIATAALTHLAYTENPILPVPGMASGIVLPPSY